MGDRRPYLVNDPGSAVPVWRETITARSDHSELRDSSDPGFMTDANCAPSSTVAPPAMFERSQGMFMPSGEGGVSTRLPDPTVGLVDAGASTSTGANRRQSVASTGTHSTRPSYAESLNRFNSARDQVQHAYPSQRGGQAFQHFPPHYPGPEVYSTDARSNQNEHGLARHPHAQHINGEGGAARSSNQAHETPNSAALAPAPWSSLPPGNLFAPSTTLSNGLSNNAWGSVTPASYHSGPSHQTHLPPPRPGAYYPSGAQHNMRPIFSNDFSYVQPLENIPVQYRPATRIEQYPSSQLHRQSFPGDTDSGVLYPSNLGDTTFGHVTNTAAPRQERLHYEQHPPLMSYPHGMGVRTSSTTVVPADDHVRGSNDRVNYLDQRTMQLDRFGASSGGSQYDAVNHLSASNILNLAEHERRFLKRKEMHALEQTSMSNMDPPTTGLSGLTGTLMAPSFSQEKHVSRYPVHAAAPDGSDLADVLAKAMRMRAELRAAPPVLPYNPAREPSASAKPIVQRDGVKYALMMSPATNGDGTSRLSKARQAEVPATCQTCDKSIANLMLRGKDVEFAPQVEFKCLACLLSKVDEPLAETFISVNSQSTTPSGTPPAQTTVGKSTPVEAKITYADTMSAEIDRMEGREVAAVVIEPSVEVGRNLPPHIKKQAFTCDICDRIIGAGQITSATLQTLPSFTVEVLCLNCIAKYKPCSDCGGGGGRLTPGRWRCKELFPAGRRTCQLSHARNPPLSDMEFETLSIVDIHPDKLDQLEARCRLVYFDTRLRSTARPEVLETGDSLALTFREAENQCIDQWNLLSSLLREDIEESRLIRRYVALHSATPHRRRAKSKVKTRDDGTDVSPSSASQPDEEDSPARDKEVTGFTLIEHDLVKGVLFYAVIMPWAVSGEAFEATSILVGNSTRKIQGDLEYLNALRRRHGLAEYPKLSAMWSLTPFQKVSRMSQSVTRRHFMFFHDYMEAHPETDKTAFPPYRKTHIPNQFLKAFNIFVRPITYGDAPADMSAKEVDHQNRPRMPKRIRSNT
ncbi:BZ3500_MvSof-1268-A1-R1_Chr10-2g02932 [Microbotryum saponariae]|uniref:BZ3500_MvSof-1268-A1-R1_Chr10-2g02932 protein n=1 Tax=Microbotryum saponariae TaxID=289078 RepID=A0A2X0KYV6_9BASI|nr:BZ3501_MvSof-1269-A2-R1_Chr10-2g02518 [Microbotryum saponariae]SDA01770.1 BZ3500_MvSof-1268-A1-R1_Chr10-2g02932 [Microbotryum saponariae]